MRILHVITSLKIGGAEKLMVDMLPRFKEAGHEAELMVFNGVETNFSESLRHAGVTIHSLSDKGNVYNPKYIFKLREFLSRYDIIHSHNTACQYFVSIASRLNRRSAVLVTTEHNTTNRRRNKWIFKLIDHWIYSNYDGIVAIAHSTARNLKHHLGDNNTAVQIIHNGINVQDYNNPIKSLPNSDEPIVITMVSAFRTQKDHETIITALSLLPGRYRLRLVGDGELRAKMEALVENMGLTHRITFLGNRSDISEIMRESDVMVLASRWEGLSLASVEGMASGRPFIASDVPGLREIVQGAGILVKDHDPEAFAEAIRSVTEDPELYHSVALSCQQRACEFDISNTVNQYLSLYEDLLNENNV